MATVRKRSGMKNGRKTTSWQATVRRGDNAPRYKTFRTKAEADAWSTSLENAMNNDEYVPVPKGEGRTVRAMLERYRKTVVPKKRDQVNQHRYLDFWIEELGDFNISAVRRAQIVEIRDRMTDKRSPATVNRYMATLRAAFQIAVTDWEWGKRSPCKRLALTEPDGRVRYLSDSEQKRLLAAAQDSRHPHLYAIVLIALTTGARRGEILNLTWADVDLKRGRAVLQKTKNTDKRSLVLVPQVTSNLRELQKIRRIDSDLVFANPNPIGKRTFPRFDDAWDEARATARLKDFRFHDLRHTFASHMAMNGKTTAEIAGALGHRTLAMVQRYAHLTEGHVHQAMESTALKILGEQK